MIEFSIDKSSVDGIVSDIKRLNSATGKSTRAGAEWAGVNIIRSLGTVTSVSKKRRKIVTQTVNGVKVRGVMIWRGDRNGSMKEVFTPIDVQQGVPVTHFVGRGNNKLVRFLKTGKVVTESQFNALNAGQLAKSASIVFIRMSGLAKNSWKWMQGKVKRGGTVSNAMGGKRLNVGAISWFGANLTIHNRLSYIRDAINGGDSSINTAVENGAKSFKWKVDQELAKLGVATT